ncbi:MAG: adenosylcobinamide-GDP ribazoletransferase [Ferrovum sp.]|nr:adenosylcobinamide-GDP ribazoletransferase [Ferrovum sp.]NDU88008.1 adenosylcobinamide-GDP ribazoletransferase [Ferrovum sp.]
MKPLRSLAIALQFLTRLPVTVDPCPTPQEMGQSVLFYPAVGALIGALLAAFSVLASYLGASSSLSGMLILSLWVGVTGALHLDGLADTVDAFAAGKGDRERTLQLMKDPHSGPFAVVSLILVLLLKAAALTTLDARLAPGFLLLPPLLGRTALPILFLTTPYVRPGGLGHALSEHLPRGPVWVVCTMTLASVLVGFGRPGIATLAIAAATALWLHHRLMVRLRGTTGDTAGALVELVETATVVTLALVAHN